MENNGNGRRWTLANSLYLITIVVTISGVVLGAYWNLMQTISSQQVTLTAAISAQQVVLAAYEARLSIAEKQIQSRLDAETAFATEMRSAIGQIQVGIADLRVQEAQRLAGGRR
jgi:hypothetical protein